MLEKLILEHHITIYMIKYYKNYSLLFYKISKINIFYNLYGDIIF